MRDEIEKIVSLIDAHGPLSQSLPGFEVRTGQIGMIRDVLHSYFEEKIALIEAGTGTGKSLAYLIPAICWAAQKNEPTVISTHTIALQEQLINKDIPFLLKALGIELKAVLVKGMSNYVCLRKVHDSENEIPDAILSWVSKSQEGSRSELPIAPSFELWEQIGAESESCTHVKCPHYKECFFFKARKEASDAHLIVANHHLLFADLSIRKENDNWLEPALLPPFKRLILDEAHHIEDVATEYFADRVSRLGLIRQLGRLISDRNTGKLLSLHQKIIESYPNPSAGTTVSSILDSLQLTLPIQKKKLIDQINLVFETLAQFLNEIGLKEEEEKLRIRENHLEHPFWKESVQAAVKLLLQSGKEFSNELYLLSQKMGLVQDDSLQLKCEGIVADIRGISSRLESGFDILRQFIFTPIEPTRVRWIESKIHLVSAHLEISTLLADSLFLHIPTIIFCSATLATNKDFTFIRKSLGIGEDAVEKIYESPFDYEKQALLSVPMDLPDPSDPTFIQKATDQIWEVLQASRGNAFVLFTSYSMLRECEGRIKDRLKKSHFPLFCQGDEGRSQLLEQFRKTERAVLFGTDSFWEGVDVVGDALRCVILVKLPFKVPSDPLFQARSEVIAKNGGSPFFDYSLPHAVVKFKQGFGRLIRNQEDRGCVVCLDSRLVKKGYGKLFLKSLPSLPHFFKNGEEVKKEIQNFFKRKKS